MANKTVKLEKLIQCKALASADIESDEDECRPPSEIELEIISSPSAGSLSSSCELSENDIDDEWQWIRNNLNSIKFTVHKDASQETNDQEEEKEEGNKDKDEDEEVEESEETDESYEAYESDDDEEEEIDDDDKEDNKNAETKENDIGETGDEAPPEQKAEPTNNSEEMNEENPEKPNGLIIKKAPFSPFTMSKLLLVLKRRQERSMKKKEKKSKDETLAAEPLPAKALEISQTATEEEESDGSEFITSISLDSADEEEKAHDVAPKVTSTKDPAAVPTWQKPREDTPHPKVCTHDPNPSLAYPPPPQVWPVLPPYSVPMMYPLGYFYPAPFFVPMYYPSAEFHHHPPYPNTMPSAYPMYSQQGHYPPGDGATDVNKPKMA